MEESRTELILLAALEALKALGGPPGLEVNRSRRQAVEPNHLPMTSVYALREEPNLPRDKNGNEVRTAPVTDRRFQFVVRSRVQGTDADADVLRRWAVKALFASAALRDLVIDLKEGETEWVAVDGAEDDFTIADTIFSARHITRRENLSLTA